MKTFALDPLTGDIVKVNGRPRIIRGREAVAQRLRVRFRFWQGSWFRDRSIGIPYARILGQKDVDTYAEGIFRRVITTCPGVASLDTFALTLDAARVARVSFRAVSIDGEPIAVNDFVAGGA